MIRKALVAVRASVKFITIFIIAALLIIGIVIFLYKPIYEVHLNGEFVGYSEDKQKLQARIDKYLHEGDGNGENVAFAQVDSMPTYELCLLKKDIVPNDEEIYNMVKSTGTVYYKYYAIAVNNEEQLNVSTFQEAETAVNELKQKNSSNADGLSIIEKYSVELGELKQTEEAIASLYQQKKVNKKVTISSSNTSKPTAGSKTGPNIGKSFRYPVASPRISSRYGRRWGRLHGGIDFAVPVRTNIYASASGTVTYSGWNSGGYGYLVIISHGNGVQTYYGHNSSLTCSVGQTVSAGDIIAKSGNTGRSTGPHCHFEIRVNGVTYNPEIYL